MQVGSIAADACDLEEQKKAKHVFDQSNAARRLLV